MGPAPLVTSTGLTVIEVQQNVDLTYRLYDYGSDRELHLDDGVAVSNPVPYFATHPSIEAEAGRTILCDGPAFVLERWVRSGEARLRPTADRPLWLIPLAGGGTLDGAPLEAGGVWLVDDEVALSLAQDTDILVAHPGTVVVRGIRGLHPRLLLPQHRHNLSLTEPALLHVRLLTKADSSSN